MIALILIAGVVAVALAWKFLPSEDEMKRRRVKNGHGKDGWSVPPYFSGTDSTCGGGCSGGSDGGGGSSDGGGGGGCGGGGCGGSGCGGSGCGGGDN